jgi:hypothetical protein
VTYTVRQTDDAGPVLGTVDAENYVHAAHEAARKFFRKRLAVRGSGWSGHPGRFFACDEYNDTVRTPFHLRVEI